MTTEKEIIQVYNDLGISTELKGVHYLVGNRSRMTIDHMYSVAKKYNFMV